MPLLGVIVWSRFSDASIKQATDVPSPDVIYSIIREPHHQSPFLSWGYFRDNWLPGYVMAFPMLLACLWVAKRGETRLLRMMALWLAGLLADLSYSRSKIHRPEQRSARFHPFRPSSLVLLLWLLLVLAVGGSDAWRPHMDLACVTPGPDWPAFFFIQGGRLVQEIPAHEALEHRNRRYSKT